MVQVIFWIILVLYVLVGIGVLKRIQTSADYYVMGWKGKAFWVAGTLMATWTSALTFLGAAGDVYSGNTYYIFILYAASIFALVILALFVARKLRAMKILTVPEFWEKRYDNKVKVTATIFMMVQAFTYAMIQLMGAGILLGELLGIDYTVIVLIFTSAMFIFCVLGGSFGVTITDTLMWLTMVVVAVIVVPLLLREAGGLQFSFQQVATYSPEYFSLSSQGFNFVSIAGLFIMIFFYMVASPLMIFRLFPAKDDFELVSVGSLTAFMLPIVCVFVFIGAMVSSQTHPGLTPPDTVYINAFINVIGGPIGAIGLAGIMAAMMSTVSSAFLLVGFGLAKDLYMETLRPLLRKKAATDRETLLFGRIGLVVVTFLCAIATITRPPAIIEVYIWGTALIAFGVGPLSLAGLIWRRATKAGAFASQIVGLVVFLTLTYVTKTDPGVTGLVAVFGAIIALVVVSLITKPTEKELACYYLTKQNEAKRLMETAINDRSVWNELAGRYRKTFALTIGMLVVVVVVLIYLIIETATF